MGGSLIVLSIMSLTAYGCGFDFRQNSVTYMLYLIYFRAGRCYDEVQWNILDGINQEIAVQPVMPAETRAVFRTLIFSVVYLTLNIFLVITCILALRESLSVDKESNFWWLITNRRIREDREVETSGFLAVLYAFHHIIHCTSRHGCCIIGIFYFRLFLDAWG